MDIRTRLPGTSTLPLRRSGSGYVAEGPGFYIWDEDPGEVLRVARELEMGRSGHSQTARVVVASPAGPDCEVRPAS